MHNKTVKIADIKGKDALFKAWLDPDGNLNYQALFAASGEQQSGNQAKPSAAGQETPWRLTADRLALQNFALQFSDQTLPKPTQINLTNVNLSSQDLSNKSGSLLPIELAMTVNDGGKINITGETVIDPFTANLKVNANQVAIGDFQAYIDQALRLDIVSGLFNLQADIAMQRLENQALAIRLQGNSDIQDFVSQDRIANQDFVTWRRLALNNININLADNRYEIETITLEHPYARVLIRKDKSVNLTDALIPKTETETETETPAEQTQATSEQPAPTFKIGRIEMSEGESDFADLSLILPFSAHINRLQGGVDGISSQQNAVAKIALAGTVEGLAPVDIEGSISPYRGDYEFKLDFRGMPMPTITPYMAEFAGRKIEKGNMSLKLQYTLQDNQLTASNKLLINQLVLGDKVENPKAVSLPLDLAIALLEDSDGKIVLDVPITGSLDNPKFSVSGIIVDALVNVITKIASSPFNALASLIDSDGDISRISFPAGKTLLTKEQQDKLNELAKALSDRPKLQLEVKGTAFSELDWPALREEALNQQLRQIRANELNRDREKS
nr:DUF748 domain-containing protein [Methylomarinum sp. Ch1-1]MDP4519173.1 DUF748 domain-containing protein [Methylomarinum sp. Ch1-1]